MTRVKVIEKETIVTEEPPVVVVKEVPVVVIEKERPPVVVITHKD